ncbi:MAG TPA: glucose-6-phosphate isomerase family protein [Bryobacteraceae bacterium]|nr:glucose-6-phosphate isomerase family protein [Bryobacteraceae bacterium]
MPVEKGLDLEATFDPVGFRYGSDMFGPAPELRRLDAIRPSLLEPHADGPDPVYAIVMDVGRPRHRAVLEETKLLFGVVAYAAGRLGREPVRSQGHVHSKSRYSGWSTPEIYEIWQGRALIVMQQSTEDDPGRFVVVSAGPGERVVAPPDWAHAVISADARHPLVFGAWCVRDYGFVYDGVRAHGGLAWFPLLDEAGEISWTPNPRYRRREVELRRARPYPELGLEAGMPLYEHLERKREAIEWVAHPERLKEVWPRFEP